MCWLYTDTTRAPDFLLMILLTFVLWIRKQLMSVLFHLLSFLVIFIHIQYWILSQVMLHCKSARICFPYWTIDVLRSWIPIVIHIPSAAAAAKSLQLCPTLCDPINGSPPGSPIPGILQARTLEWVAISFSNAWKWKVKVKSLSRVQLFNPMDCSLSASSIHEIF